jgi:UV DNA damage repair endonuclease
MCELCDLNASDDGFILTLCNNCHIPLVVSRFHRPEFTPEERQKIMAIFPGRRIRWEMRKIHDHAHCHIEG